MPSHKVLAIANEFLRRANEENTSLTQMQLHKLIHIANGWNLAISEKPLVEEAAQAWDNGPVFRSLWNHVRDFGQPAGLLEAPFGPPFKAAIGGSEKEVIDEVWKKYGRLSGTQLSRMTHNPDTPWTRAYLRGRNSPILEIDMKEHYAKLARQGRRAA